MNRFCEYCKKQFYRRLRNDNRKRNEAITTFEKRRRFCSNKCVANWREEQIKLGKLKCKPRNKLGTGSNNPNWKGGITKINDKIRKSPEYKQWRTLVFERDKYTCKECGKIGGYLEAHHIKDFSEYPELRFDINNGITLCRKCHSKTFKFYENQFTKK